MDYMCRHCKFSFSSVDTKKDRCPYCGEKSYLAPVQRAEDLIDGVDKY